MIALKLVSATYTSRGFTIVAAAADNGFSTLEHNLEFVELQITLNLATKDDHEPYIEMFNRIIKEKYKMGITGVPFTKLPKRMAVELVHAMILWYNFIILDDYISNALGPGAIILGRTYDYNILCEQGSKFEENVQTHEKTTINMLTRTVSVIYLRPSGNTQGSFYYYSLWTGFRLHMRRQTPLPMPQEVIDRVHHIANR